MRQEPEERESERGARMRPEDDRSDGTDHRLFPYNSVVGVIDDPSDVAAAVSLYSRLVTLGMQSGTR